MTNYQILRLADPPGEVAERLMFADVQRGWEYDGTSLTLLPGISNDATRILMAACWLQDVDTGAEYPGAAWVSGEVP